MEVTVLRCDCLAFAQIAQVPEKFELRAWGKGMCSTGLGDSAGYGVLGPMVKTCTVALGRFLNNAKSHSSESNMWRGHHSLPASGV